MTAATALAVTAAMGLTLLGLGLTDHAAANFDASSWLWSSVKGELARVNGVTGRVDTRQDLAGAAGHRVQIAQTDRLILLRDISTGRVSALDLATLRATATTPTTSGIGVTVALHEDGAFVVDSVQGIVRQLDPSTLTPVGEPVRLPPGVTGGVFDGAGRLWVGVPSEGTVVSVTPAGADASPAVTRTEAVASPQQDLAVAALDDGVAVLNRTSARLTSLRGGERRETPLTLDGPAALPPRIVGDTIAVTIADTRTVHVVTPDAQVRSFTVPGAGDRLRPAVPWAGRFYCPDDAAGRVHVLDAAGSAAPSLSVTGANGPLELEVRERRLFINAPDGSTAQVVNDQHQATEVDKYADGVLGADPPPDPPRPPPPPKPRRGPPDAPAAVAATAGDEQARVSWRAAKPNGWPVLKYVVTGVGGPREVSARQRELTVEGLTNGESYRFAVHAVNAKGPGPKRFGNPVMPTRDVPDPPESVTASPRPDGTVTVGWPRANGQGRRIVRYSVTAVTEGASEQVGASRTMSLRVKGLEYGRQYSFTVAAVNDRGASSKASPQSGSVSPFSVPGQPKQLRARTVSDKKGTIALTWGAAEENGKPITGYEVAANGRRVEVAGLSAQVDGFGDGERVSVRVLARNEAGAGRAASALAQTLPQPTIVPLKVSNAYSVITIPLRTTNAATCQVSLNGGARKEFDCRGGPVRELTPGETYRYQVFARNAAGEVSIKGERRTLALFGKVACDDSAGPNRGYCDRGIGVYSGARQHGSEGVGTVRSGDRFRAFCKRRGSDGDQSDGATLSATGYNNDKRSDMWVQITFGDARRYIPFIWLNLENGDKINDLPSC
ncbi:fibronectin type III domain-containing protein [Pilimelia columellifera]|uniref:fibronectin type III domain-containing protein n=1 Tax=Pilimelia columellifera TaxID=706574 RepID=UPI003CD0875C